MMRGLLLAGAATATALCSAASAAPVADQTTIEGSAAAATSVEEVIVTAQKRSESVQSVPLAVTALGGEALQRRNVTTVQALSQMVPGLNVSEQVGQARLTLR